MKLLNEYYKAKQAIYKHFDLDKKTSLQYIIIDETMNYWCIKDCLLRTGERSFSNEDDVNEDVINGEVKRASEYTLIPNRLMFTNDEVTYLSIFDNKKEIK